jgi:cyclic beta-1,2-glucan synthetase
VNHSRSPQAAGVYKVEPYVVSADVNAVAPHVGRGGWSWYTGSAGWLYRLIAESILGLTREADRLRIRPCIPRARDCFSVAYRCADTRYEISVTRDASASAPLRLLLDGVAQHDGCIVLVNDAGCHAVAVILPPA